jgi:hypothetical protein
MPGLRLGDDLVRVDGLQCDGRIGWWALGADLVRGLPWLVLGFDEEYGDAFIGAQAAEPGSPYEAGLGLGLGDDDVLEDLAGFFFSGRVDFHPDDDSVHFRLLVVLEGGAVVTRAQRGRHVEYRSRDG